MNSTRTYRLDPNCVITGGCLRPKNHNARILVDSPCGKNHQFFICREHNGRLWTGPLYEHGAPFTEEKMARIEIEFMDDLLKTLVLEAKNTPGAASEHKVNVYEYSNENTKVFYPNNNNVGEGGKLNLTFDNVVPRYSDSGALLKPGEPGANYDTISAPLPMWYRLQGSEKRERRERNGVLEILDPKTDTFEPYSYRKHDLCLDSAK